MSDLSTSGKIWNYGSLKLEVLAKKVTFLGYNFDFRHLMSHRGREYSISEKVSPCYSLGSQISFENRHSSRKKVSFLGLNFQLQCTLIPDFATR